MGAGAHSPLVSRPSTLGHGGMAAIRPTGMAAIRPTRICFIRQGYYPLDTRVRRQVRALTLAGHEVDVICLSRPGEPRFERQDKVTVHRVPITKRRAGHFAYLTQYGAFFVFAMWMATVLHLRRRYELVQVFTLPDVLVLR